MHMRACVRANDQATCVPEEGEPHVLNGLCQQVHLLGCAVRNHLIVEAAPGLPQAVLHNLQASGRGAVGQASGVSKNGPKRRASVRQGDVGGRSAPTAAAAAPAAMALNGQKWPLLWPIS